MKYITLAALWTSYCILHSLLISNMVTVFMRKFLNDFFRFYRVIYNAISLMLLVPLIIYTQRTGDSLIFYWSGNLVYFRYVLIMVAVVIVIAALFEYDISAFTGLQGIWNRTPVFADKISDSGILGYIRHPFYTATFIFIWGRNITQADLIVNIIITLYLVIGTRLEERKLILQFGDHYIEYTTRVSMYIPVKWLASLIRQRLCNLN